MLSVIITDLVKYISFLSFTSTCVGWYLRCQDSVTLATFWDNIFPVLQWHFKNSVFTSKRHPLAPWRCDSVVAEQRDTRLEISSGCISSHYWLLLLHGGGWPCILWKKEATKTSRETVIVTRHWNLNCSVWVQMNEICCVMLTSFWTSLSFSFQFVTKWHWAPSDIRSLLTLTCCPYGFQYYTQKLNPLASLIFPMSHLKVPRKRIPCRKHEEANYHPLNSSPSSLFLPVPCQARWTRGREGGCSLGTKTQVALHWALRLFHLRWTVVLNITRVLSPAEQRAVPTDR